MDRVQWEIEVIRELEDLFDATTSDVQGILRVPYREKALDEAWSEDLSVEDAAKKVFDATEK